MGVNNRIFHNAGITREDPDPDISIEKWQENPEFRLDIKSCQLDLLSAHMAIHRILRDKEDMHPPHIVEDSLHSTADVMYEIYIGVANKEAIFTT